MDTNNIMNVACLRFAINLPMTNDFSTLAFHDTLCPKLSTFVRDVLCFNRASCLQNQSIRSCQHQQLYTINRMDLRALSIRSVYPFDVPLLSYVDKILLKYFGGIKLHCKIPVLRQKRHLQNYTYLVQTVLGSCMHHSICNCEAQRKNHQRYNRSSTNMHLKSKIESFC